MDTIGLRELSHHTAQIVRRVRNGETVIVTDHGRPVVRMTPEPATSSLLARLTAEGAVVPATDDTPFTVPEGDPTEPSLSDRLIAARDEERW
ncbi:type II toxin-antitoxin system Phd/YefM family antitoxin [Glycomyces paridis]|uniref:Antitoxin n=1 Tax=Glycomyces paridis TaxID=2126555 RepID=A0A4S8PDK2_9ACTN|nr:type II toxin-antitoxin system prevent-host-death family antitoxin [Glycomyces paridis]THV27272.1 type II toxin-antitoxin system prevent-host-death family antitoxin [Glycomyces paridis]